MIYARLHGRLGNQMFQYATAAGLAARQDTSVALDKRGALHRGEGVLTRVFDPPLVTPEHLPPTKHSAPLSYGIWRATGRKPKFRREKGLAYNPAIKAFGDDSYLHGYWQSEKYFAHIADDIRKAFQIVPEMSERNADMARQIQGSLSISLHVRRGDYLTLAPHVMCDQAYYDAALAQVVDGLSEAPTVYVFSDDPEWAKANLPLPFEKVVVDFNGPDTDYEDLRLMSLCQHNIVANSSFSWWGAWLNTNPDKRVAGPASWFSDPTMDSTDILPDAWMRISA